MKSIVKLCTYCLEAKHLDMFNLNYKDQPERGRHSYCRSCARITGYVERVHGREAYLNLVNHLRTLAAKDIAEARVKWLDEMEEYDRRYAHQAMYEKWLRDNPEPSETETVSSDQKNHNERRK